MVIQARKRFVVAFIVALFLAWFAVTATAQVMIPKPAICNETGPLDWEWWAAQCYLWSAPESNPARVTRYILR